MNGGVPQFDVHLDGNYDNAISAESLPPEEWAHVTGVFDGAQLRIYVNRLLTGSKKGEWHSYVE
jgi:hypothetical protein